MKLKVKLRNILYWTKSLFTRYKEIEIEIDDKNLMQLYQYANEKEMTLNQLVNTMLVDYMKKYKLPSNLEGENGGRQG